MDELGDGCSNNDLDPHVQRRSQHSPAPALLCNGLHAVFACVLQSYVSSPQLCQGMSAEEPEAVSDLTRAPLTSEPALHNQFLTLFLMLKEHCHCDGAEASEARELLI